MSLSPTHQSGWIATVMFFSQNVGSAIVMLITALLFTLVTALMALVLIKVSEHIHSKHTHFKCINPHRGLKTHTNTHSEHIFSSHMAGAQTVPWRRW